ncbi:MAG: PQQ-binding-like beta-propeller repeat protein, partial [Candidatus Competibacterales bacterium]
MSKSSPGLAFATALALASASPALMAVTDEDIRDDANTPEDVVTYGMGLQAQRYSALEQVNKDTVKDLVPAWSFSFGGEKQRGQESQPLIKDGVMYVTGSYSRLYAIDARTGQELWQYDHRLPSGILPCCDVVNRGAALYDDLVIFGTLDAQLVALDRETGRVRWRDRIDDYRAGYSYTAAPLIVDGLVFTGVSGGEFGVIGRVEARDAKTGDLAWIRPVIEGHMGYIYRDGDPREAGVTGGEAGRTWPGDTWKHGGGAPWLGGTYAPDTNLLFFGTGNPAPWNAPRRPGDNIYTSSTIA